MILYLENMAVLQNCGQTTARVKQNQNVYEESSDQAQRKAVNLKEKSVSAERLCLSKFNMLFETNCVQLSVWMPYI